MTDSTKSGTALIVFSLLVLCAAVLMVCCNEVSQPESKSGVKAIGVNVQTNAEGITVEQQNIRDRLLVDNKPGSIKHLYVISAYSGQVLIYSTVRGKVTSSGKRLSPTTVGVTDGTNVSSSNRGFRVDFSGNEKRTGEVLQDDGSYGASIPYLYWWDATGKYHQHYVSGGQILHVSDQPIAVKSIEINMSVTTD